MPARACAPARNCGHPPSTAHPHHSGAPEGQQEGLTLLPCPRPQPLFGPLPLAQAIWSHLLCPWGGRQGSEPLRGWFRHLCLHKPYHPWTIVEVSCSLFSCLEIPSASPPATLHFATSDSARKTSHCRVFRTWIGSSGLSEDGLLSPREVTVYILTMYTVRYCVISVSSLSEPRLFPPYSGQLRNMW